MTQTLAIILPWLQFLAGAGSGMAASWLFTKIRKWLPKDQVVPWLARGLYAPRYARCAVLLLAAIISVVASLLVGVFTNGDLPAIFDATAAAALAGVASQLTHAAQLPTTVPDPPAQPPLSGTSQRDGARIYPQHADYVVIDEAEKWR